MIVREDELDMGALPVNKIVLGDSLTVLKKFPDNSIDAVVTDPPYGLRFMNQKWDYDVPSVELWKEVLRVLKPGGHLLSFFGTRTYHRGVVNIEDAGFEIRDMIQWIYSCGFPKSMDISKAIDKEFGKLEEREVIGTTRCGYRRCGRSDVEVFHSSLPKELEIVPITAPATPEAKQWQGWGTSLKPACEPIVLARKPLSEKNVAQNVLKWGVGGLNIGACRIPVNDGELRPQTRGGFVSTYNASKYNWGEGDLYLPHEKGRYPANVILDEVSAKILDEQAPKVGGGHWGRCKVTGYGKFGGGKVEYFGAGEHDGLGEASRFFYCAKAGRDERFAYCQDCDEVIPQKEWCKHKDHKVIFHTTVKPLKLMEYLVRLVTPPDGIVLDPFFGTGTTGIACLKQGFRFIGIEIDPIYCKIAEHRLKPHLQQKKLVEFV